MTTLLLNFVILIFLQMMLEGPLKDPMGLGWPQSSPILDQGMLPPLMERMRLHSGLIIALVAAVVAQFMLARSVWGFRLRAVGENAAAARHAGIRVNRTLFSVAIVSGALAGMAGVSEVAGLEGLSDRRSVAGVWLYRDRRGDAGGAVAGGRCDLGAVHRLGLCRCGFDEPGDGRVVLSG